MVICAGLIWGKTTGWGDVRQSRVNFVYTTEDGERNTGSYILMVPKDASSANKVPGTVITHGIYSNGYSVKGYAIELARRGYAVALVDVPSSGQSTMLGKLPYSNGMDLTPFQIALGSNIRSLDFLDMDNLISIGFSGGRNASTDLAMANPGMFKSVVHTSAYRPDAGEKINAAGMNYFGVAADSSAAATAGGALGDGLVGSGDWDAHTANYCYINSRAVTHVFQPTDSELVGAVIDACMLSSPTGSTLPGSEQNFNTDLPSIIGFIALGVLVVNLAYTLLSLDFFKSLTREPATTYPVIYNKQKGAKRQIIKWVWILLPMLLVCICYELFAARTQIIQPFSGVGWAGSWANVYIPFLIATGLVNLGIFAIYHFKVGKANGATAYSYGIAYEKNTILNILKGILLGFIIVLVVLGVFTVFDTVMCVSYMYNTIVLLCSLSFETFIQIPIYIVLFLFVYASMSFKIFVANKFIDSGNAVKDTILSDILVTIAEALPFFILVGWRLAVTEEIITLAGTNYGPWHFLPMNSMYGWPFLLLLIMPILNHINRKTNSVWPGACVTGVLMAYIILCNFSIQASYF